MIIRAIKSVAPKALFALGLFVALAACGANAHAQATGNTIFHVPFEFTVGGVRLPAGEYTVRRTSQAGLAYFVKSIDGHAAAAVIIQSALRAKGSERPVQLTFDVAGGGGYYLAEVWPTGDGTGAKLKAPRAARDTAMKASETSRVIIMAQNRY
jgi:hypothetical protein